MSKSVGFDPRCQKCGAPLPMGNKVGDCQACGGYDPRFVHELPPISDQEKVWIQTEMIAIRTIVEVLRGFSQARQETVIKAAKLLLDLHREEDKT